MTESALGKPLRLLAISGSLRKSSTNTAALEALARLAPRDTRVDLYRDLARLPPFNPDDDAEDIAKPAAVEAFRDRVGRATPSSSLRPNMRAGSQGRSRTRSTGWSRAKPSPASRSRRSTPRRAPSTHKRPCAKCCRPWRRASFPKPFASLPLTGKVVVADDILADSRLTRRLTDALAAAVRNG